MELFINKIHLAGCVGQAHTSRVQDKTQTRFTLVVTKSYRGIDGNPVVDTNWFYCTTFDESAQELKKGDWVELTGRISNRISTAEDGTTSVRSEITCNTFEILPKD